jgi:hypothetical protein
LVRGRSTKPGSVLALSSDGQQIVFLAEARHGAMTNSLPMGVATGIHEGMWTHDPSGEKPIHRLQKGGRRLAVVVRSTEDRMVVFGITCA